MNVLQCHSCAQTLDRGERCIGPEVIRKGFIAGHFYFIFYFLYLLNTSTNIFCQYCPRLKTLDVDQS